MHDTQYTSVQSGLAILQETGMFDEPKMVDNMAMVQRRNVTHG